MIRVINIIWGDRDANLARSPRRMLINCLWWMLFLGRSRRVNGINQHQCNLKALLSPGALKYLYRTIYGIAARTNGFFWHSGLKPWSHPPIPQFIKREVGHRQNGRHLATLSVPLPVSICFSQAAANKRLLSNTLTQSALKTDRQAGDLLPIFEALFNMQSSANFSTAPPLITCLNRIPVRVARRLHKCLL